MEKILNGGDSRHNIAQQKAIQQYTDLHNLIKEAPENISEEDKKIVEEALRKKSEQTFQKSNSDINPIGGEDDGMLGRAYLGVRKFANEGVKSLNKLDNKIGLDIIPDEYANEAEDRIKAIENREKLWKGNEAKKSGKKSDDIWNIAGGLGEVMPYVAGGAYVGVGEGATVLARTLGTVGRGAISDAIMATTQHFGDDDAKTKIAQEVGYGVLGGIIGQVGGDKLLAKIYKSKGLGEKEIAEKLSTIKNIAEEQKLKPQPIKPIVKKAVAEELPSAPKEQIEEIEKMVAKQLDEEQGQELQKVVTKLNEEMSWDEAMKETPTKLKEPAQVEPTPLNNIDDVKAHPRYEELLDSRKDISAKESKYGQRQIGKGALRQDGEYVGGNVYEKNYASDFELTKADVKKINNGEMTPELEQKLINDLGRLDNDPMYAKIEETKTQNPNAEMKGDELIDSKTGQVLFSTGGNAIGSALGGATVGGASALIDDKLYGQNLTAKDYLTRIGLGALAGGLIGKYAKSAKGGRVGMFAGTKAKGFKEAEKQGKVFSNIHDKKVRFEIDDSGAKIKTHPYNLKDALANHRLETAINKGDAVNEEVLKKIDKFKGMSEEQFFKNHNSIKEKIGKELNKSKIDHDKIDFLVKKREPYDTMEHLMKNRKYGKLSDYLKHDELFKNYPELQDMHIRLDSSIEANGAYFSKTEGKGEQIVLNPSNFNKKETLLHEIQHAIQAKEGFGRGGNINNLTAKELSDTVLQKYGKLPSMQKIEDDFLDGKITEDEMYSKIINTSLSNYGGISKLKHDTYQRILGEQEARDVSARANLTKAEREKTLPFEKLKETEGKLQKPIVKNKSDVSLSTEKPNDKTTFLGKTFKATSTVAQALKPVEYPFQKVTDALNKLNKIANKATKALTDTRIKGKSFDDFMRSVGMDNNAFKRLGRKESDKVVKQYYKYKADLSKGDIKAKEMSRLEKLGNWKDENKKNELIIKYLENPKARDFVKENFLDMSKELDAVVDAIDEIGRQKVKQGIIAQGQYDKWKGRYLSRLYDIKAGDTPSNMDITRGLKAYNEESGRKIESIIDYIEHLRKTEPDSEYLKTIVTDPVALIKTTIAKGQANIAVDKFYRGLISDPKIVNQDYLVKVPKVDGLDLPELASPYYAKHRLAGIVNDKAFDKEIDKKILAIEQKWGDPEISNTIKNETLLDERVKGRYGVFSGLPVNDDIANLIKGTQRIFEDPLSTANRLDAATTKALAYFKWAKVAANPFSYPRNFMGNIFNWTLSGANPASMPRMILEAFDEVANKGKWYKLAQENGLFHDNLASVEINSILKQMRDASKSSKVKAVYSIMEKAGDAYGSVDDFWKLARMKYGIEKEGLSPTDAIIKAHETHFDYSLTYDLIKAMRDPNMKNGAMLKMVGSMFPTFTQKAAASFYNTARERPATLAALLGAGYGISTIFEDRNRVALGDKYEAYEYFKPKFLDKYGVLSYVDKDKNIVYIDTGYVIPFGQVMEIADSVVKTIKDPNRGLTHLIDGVKNLGLGGNPIYAIKDIMNNKNSFTGLPIYYPYNAVETAKGVSKFFFDLMAPGLLTNTYRYSQTRHPVIPRVITGANIYKYDTEQLIRRKQWEEDGFKKRVEQAGRFESKYRSNITYALQDFKKGKITKEKLNEVVDENLERLEFFRKEKEVADEKKKKYIKMAKKTGVGTSLKNPKPRKINPIKRWADKGIKDEINSDARIIEANMKNELYFSKTKRPIALKYIKENKGKSKEFIKAQSVLIDKKIQDTKEKAKTAKSKGAFTRYKNNIKKLRAWKHFLNKEAKK